MPTSVKQMMEAANAVVQKITLAEARDMMAKGNTLVVDVRDAPEVEKSGKIAGAVHHSRGMLEFRADPDSPYYDKNFAKDKSIMSIALRAVARLWLVRCSKIWGTPKCTTWVHSKIGPRAAVR
jgi:rhodanese-related sulfurtransferase